MVIVTRDDLKLSIGKLAAQVAHAAVECTLIAKKEKSKWFREWFNQGAKKAVVKTDVLDDFSIYKKRADKLSIPAVIIIDAGHTEIAPGTQTVLGIGPAPTNLIDQVTGSLSLL
ncbi:MAG: peptidyl-tRNA hydrolase [Candidatus Thermoplasmatota archaeon]|nr:peptidyl-tRNA hydrolase [Candidatus Thermoplasmatota archaeon]